MHDTQIVSEVTINAPIQKVWDFLVDPNKIPLVMPSLVENTNVPALPLTEGAKFNYKYQMYGVILEGELHVTKLTPPSYYEFDSSGDGESHWEYRLSETPDGTHIGLKVSYKTPETVMQKVKTQILTKINQREVDTYLQNLKTVLEMQG